MLETWLQQLAEREKIVSADVPFQYGGIPLKPLPRTFSDRVLVVGDAAGQVKPVTGGGIYFGLLCADIAADHLDRALRNGDLSARSLAGYERAWRQRLGKELKQGYFARRMYERLGYRTLDKLFRTVRDRGIAEALLEDPSLKFDWHGGALRRLVTRHPGLVLRAFLISGR